MKRGTIRRLTAACLLAAVVSTGCGSAGTAVQESAQGAAQEQPAVQQSDYSVYFANQGITLPVSTSSVFVNQNGYVDDREKKVLFLGGQHGSEFRVVRKSDGEIVYTGNIEDGSEDKLSSVYLSVGDFSEFTETGTYYIETDIVGQSYPFDISQDSYEKLFVGLLKNAGSVQMAQDAQGVCSTSFGMHVIMYAMQCNGAVIEEAYQDFEDDDRQLVTQLLYFASQLLAQQQPDGSLYGDYEATAAFCGIMAMSRDVFGKYEASVAKEYQDASDSAWQWLESMECDTDEKKCARFYAAAQLFKAEYSDKYKKIVEEFLTERDGGYSSAGFVFYGVASYLSAEKNADRDLCSQIMKDLVNEVEQLCEEAGDDDYFGTGRRGISDSLYMMLLLSFMNYVTPSREYAQLVENTIQYMGGLNENGACYLDSSGVWQELSQTAERSLEWNAVMIFGMSDLLSNLNDIENS